MCVERTPHILKWPEALDGVGVMDALRVPRDGEVAKQALSQGLKGMSGGSFVSTDDGALGQAQPLCNRSVTSGRRRRRA